ncbi:MAG: sel1 repeat family protein, partial [Oscillospiraceae bacterium]|nr:sel1 repeat family protein [Oscillospiraceae bacterium]
EATHCTAALGCLHLDGRGTPENPVAALRYFTMAAKEGSTDGMMYLGLMHYRGQATPQNTALALEWLEKAAALENRDAAGWLADIYLSAPEPHRNPRRAKIMATAGLESAFPFTVAFCHNILGWLYQNGLGTDTDLSSAFLHYRLAAEGGSPEGMFNLAHCYYEGMGTAPSTADARHWLREAAYNADDDPQLRQEALEALKNI